MPILTHLQDPNNTYGSIIFPAGFAGNHLRWLLFLDPRYDVSKSICANTVSRKLKFIQKNVYPDTRTWYNWLTTEWKYRVALNDYIEIVHAQFNWENSSNKELYLTTKNLDLPFHHYFHLNLGLNAHTPEYFQEMNQAWVNEFEVLELRIHEFDNKKICDCDPLFSPTLSKEFYTDVINFYGFDDNYDSAQQVHQWYHACRVKSVKDFCEYIASNSFKSRIEFLTNSI